MSLDSFFLVQIFFFELLFSLGAFSYPLVLEVIDRGGVLKQELGSRMRTFSL